MAVSLLLFVILVFLSTSIRTWAEVLLLKIKTVVEKSVRDRMTDALLGMQWASFMDIQQGDISKSLVMEGLQIGTGAQHAVSAWASALAAGCYFVVAVAISPVLAAMAVAFGVVCAGIYVLGARRVRSSSDALSHLSGQISEASASIFGNLKFFRASGLEGEARTRARQLFNRFADAYFSSHVFPHYLRGVIESLAGIFVALFLVLQLWVLNGTVAQALIFLAVFYRMAPRLLNLQSNYFHAKTYLVWMRSFDQRMQMAAKSPDAPTGAVPATLNDRIEFREVTFQYPSASHAAISNVSLSLRRGEYVALVGGSGSGKSTMADLLTGLLTPQSGSIRVDDVDLRALSVNSWRHRLGVVMQDGTLFNDTVAANIAFGEKSVDLQRVEQALKQAHAWDFVERLPSGMQAPVAERGARFSGGQRQRLAIARALYRSPDLLILDEATSALDSDAESEVQRAIDAMKGSVTILAIAHRLRTVMGADRIVVMRAGHILEEGSWSDLMARRGELHRMASMQELT